MPTLSYHPTTLLLGALAALACFALLTVRVARSPDGDAFRLDGWMRALAEPRFHPAGHAVAKVISIPGYPGVYMPFAALAGWALHRRGAPGAWALPASALLGWALHRVVKRFLKRKRPPTVLARGKTEPAFPSGHTTGTTSAVLPFAMLVARSGMWGLWYAVAVAALVAVLVGLSRIYLDEHWATDVLGGLCLGGAAAFLCVGLSS